MKDRNLTPQETRAVKIVFLAGGAAVGIGFLFNLLPWVYPADLSNERHSDVVRRRTILIGQIQDIITNRLAARPI